MIEKLHLFSTSKLNIYNTRGLQFQQFILQQAHAIKNYSTLF